MKIHHYKTKITWTGNTGEGTKGYLNYKRSHTISKDGASDILCSSDPAFRGDPSKFNPEDLLMSSISSCHMLWYLHLCADSNIKVIKYEDSPEGFMEEQPDGGGSFKSVNLHPIITIEGAEFQQIAIELHIEAHSKCFIARSCNFEVYIDPVVNFV